MLKKKIPIMFKILRNKSRFFSFHTKRYIYHVRSLIQIRLLRIALLNQIVIDPTRFLVYLIFINLNFLQTKVHKNIHHSSNYSIKYNIISK